MTVHFRRAISSEAKPLVGLYAESGRGKTKSALLLAKGFEPDMSKVGMIETESGRGEAYADDREVGGYNVLPMRSDFSPKAYGAAIGAAESAGLRALIIDSASHEWEGVGGVLAMAADNQAAGKKGVLVWQQPKMQHAREFMLRLQQTPIPLVIVCMRAKYPMYEVTSKHVEKWDAAGRPGGKPPRVGDWARSWQLEPKQADDILFEMFVHGWIDEEHRLHVTKYTLDEEMRRVFIDGQPITTDTGARLAAWASGRKESAPQEKPGASNPPAPAGTPAAAGAITESQVADLKALCQDKGVAIAALLARAEVASIEQIAAADYDGAARWVNRQQRAA
jgi:hypothetical protein